MNTNMKWYVYRYDPYTEPQKPYFADSGYDRNQYSQGPENKWPLYRWNLAAASLHALQCFIVLILIFTQFSDIPVNVPFVSGVQELRFTSQAMLVRNSTASHCANVKKSPMYSQDNKSFFRNDVVPFNVYDFTDKFLVVYNIPGNWINTPACICMFFLLSAIFQFGNGALLNSNPDQPRLMHYLEYSISSSLVVIVMAVQSGVMELFTITSFFALFFGMNLFGVCAEVMMYLAERGEGGYRSSFVWGWSTAELWLLPHLAGWVLFLFTLIPILYNFHTISACSDDGAGYPWFVITAVYGEVVFFLCFGFIQAYGLYKRTQNIQIFNNSNEVREGIIYLTDALNITASFVAKTSLCWLLLGPSLSAKKILSGFVE